MAETDTPPAERKSGGAGALKGNVDVPGIGPVKKKTLAIVGGLAAVFVLWRYWQAREADAEVVGDSDGDGFADGGMLPSVSGAVSPDNSYGRPQDDAGAGPSPDDFGFNGTTNAQWTQYAATQLTGSETWSYTAILTALGKYLNGKPLSATEIEIVQAAIAVAGYPPVGQHPIIPGGSTPVLVAPTGLKGEAVSDTGIALSWNAVSGAVEYAVYQGGAEKVQVTGTSTTITGLTPSTTYSYQVAALSAGDVPGPKSGSVSVKTKAKPTTVTPTKPAPTNPTPSKPSKPRYRVMTITKTGQTLSHLVAAYNKKYGTKHTVTSIWNYNLQHRPASTVKTLKARGPNKVYRGSSFWFPY